VPINDADSFFTALQEKVAALAEFNQPHPLSAAAALATSKRYLAEDKYRIRLSDLIHEEAKRVTQLLWDGEFGNFNATFDGPTLTRRVRYYDQTCQSLVAMGFACGKWGDEDLVVDWQSLQKQLYGKIALNGNSALLKFQKYPISLISYACCMGAAVSDNLRFICRLLTTKLRKENARDATALNFVPPFRLVEADVARYLVGVEGRGAPLNDWIHDALYKQIGSEFPSKEEFTLCFDRIEIMIALVFGAYGASASRGHFPLGGYGYRYENFEIIMAEFEGSINSLGATSPFIESEIFGGSIASANENIGLFKAFTSEQTRLWH
jgi:hypothetical protein